MQSINWNHVQACLFGAPSGIHRSPSHLQHLQFALQGWRPSPSIRGTEDFRSATALPQLAHFRIVGSRLRWEGTYIGEIVSEWLVRPDVQFRIESMLLIYRIRKADDISSVVIRWLNEKKKLGSGWSRYPPTEAIQTTEIAIARWGQSVYQHCI
ncbi:hypothetical protein PABG_11629 [Paracoccidioides brasiliensis Pb03]|nr:hypothetical protein PABG_11629 [Paracoccidioides brasiliensis Pb03]